MDEQQIVERLAKTIPRDNVLTADVVPEEATPNQDMATINVEAPIEPMIGYKLSEILGVGYDPKDTEINDRLDYIYNAAKERAGSEDWVEIASTIRELTYMLGSHSAKDPIQNLYQWIKLDEGRKRIEREQSLYVNRG